MHQRQSSTVPCGPFPKDVAAEKEAASPGRHPASAGLSGCPASPRAARTRHHWRRTALPSRSKMNARRWLQNPGLSHTNISRVFMPRKRCVRNQQAVLRTGCREGRAAGRKEYCPLHLYEDGEDNRRKKNVKLCDHMQPLPPSSVSWLTSPPTASAGPSTSGRPSFARLSERPFPF